MANVENINENKVREGEAYIVKKKMLANSLSYLGFKYSIFTGNEGRVVYRFEDTVELRNTITILLDIRNKNNK